MTEPFRPLTPAQLEVAQCVAKGWDYARIGEWLGIAPSTARVHVAAIAQLLPDPDHTRAYRRVFLWAVRQPWGNAARKGAA